MLIISTYVEYFDSNIDIKESHGAFSILSELLYHLIGNDCLPSIQTHKNSDGSSFRQQTPKRILYLCSLYLQKTGEHEMYLLCTTNTTLSLQRAFKSDTLIHTAYAKNCTVKIFSEATVYTLIAQVKLACHESPHDGP